MKIPKFINKHGWYLKVAKLRPESRFFGYKFEILEYATYHWFGLYFFVVYLNDWRHDA